MILKPEYIKMLRKQKGYSQRELAEYCRIDFSRLQRYEQSKLKGLREDEYFKLYLYLGGSRTIYRGRPKTSIELFFDVIESEHITMNYILQESKLDQESIMSILTQSGNKKEYHRLNIGMALGFSPFEIEHQYEWDRQVITNLDNIEFKEYRKILNNRYKKFIKRQATKD